VRISPKRRAIAARNASGLRDAIRLIGPV
jgi:hypothetical protein